MASSMSTCCLNARLLRQRCHEIVFKLRHFRRLQRFHLLSTSLSHITSLNCIHRKIVGPHICGDALDIEPFTLNVLTGSWRVENQVEVSVWIEYLHWDTPPLGLNVNV